VIETSEQSAGCVAFGFELVVLAAGILRFPFQIEPAQDWSHDFDKLDGPWTSALRRSARSKQSVAGLVDWSRFVYKLGELLPHPLDIDAVEVHTVIIRHTQTKG
jgi:hypothetical protein